MDEGKVMGTILIVFMSIIVGLILFQVIAQQVGESTNTITLANQTLGDLNNGTAVYVTNCKALSSVMIFNATGDVEIPSDEYTVTNNVINPTTSALSVKIVPEVDIAKGYDKGVATIDGVCQPLTYISNSGGRAMASLIVIGFALAIAIVALSPTVREGLANFG